MKRRGPKPDDQENATKACGLLNAMVKLHPEIDCNCWVSGCLSSIAATYVENGIGYPTYKKEMEEAVKFYKSYWEEDDNTTK
jgi:hypothetical protein